MKDLCMVIWLITLMMFHQKFSAASEKVFVPKTCDLFVVNKEVNFSSYADDITFVTGMSFEQFIPELESILLDISQRFMNIT